jgi:transcriptional pleiotropic regulator of transition state genes
MTTGEADPRVGSAQEQSPKDSVLHATGIVRRVDDLGRIVLPKSLRLALGFTAGRSVEIELRDGEYIVLTPSEHQEACVGCGGHGQAVVLLHLPHGLAVCTRCAGALVRDWLLQQPGSLLPFLRAKERVEAP